MKPILSILCLGLALNAVFFTAAVAKEKPNILFIAIDDQNDWIGCMKGHPQVKTPNIDGLASKGMLFSNAHCQSPLCNSSRISVMTGLRPSTTGVYGLAPTIRQVEEFKDVVTLPQYLKRNGYTTYMGGKIFHGGYGRQKKHAEFDHVGPPAGVGVKPPKKLVDTPTSNPWVDWGTFDHRDEEKGDWTVASYGVETLDAKPQEPFFLSVGFFLPHVPCYVTKKWYDMYPEETLELPPFLADDRNDTPRFSWHLHWKLPEPRHEFLVRTNQWKNLVRSYLASTSFVDSQVGRVLDALERNGYADNTIVVLWSDHGFHLGEKEITGKNTLWDRSTRVPLIFAGPGVLRGQTCSQPAELLDLYPTLLELTGLPKNEALEGLSLMPQLIDSTTKRMRPAITTHNHDNHGIRSQNWRFIQYADGSEELYDMKADPNEWKNLIEDSAHTSVIQEHRKWLPKVNRKPVPGSKHRILTFENGEATWEGSPIKPGDPIPEIDTKN
jgi:arylsulfatase A-like enzyme